MTKTGVLQHAPDFSLRDHDGTARKLSDYLGTRVLLVFYPKDRTPCCRREKIALRDKLRVLLQHGVGVVAISHDQVADHAAYVHEYEIEFPLLQDLGHIVAKLYGVTLQKSYRSAPYTAVESTAFMIGAAGQIEKTFTNFNLELQALGVLE